MSNSIESIGVVYVLTNESMPGLVKIGISTEESIYNRLKSLNNTSVPKPFNIEYACIAKEYKRVEKSLHHAFLHKRAGKEFFSIDPSQAIKILELVTIKDITNSIGKKIDQELTPEQKAAKKRPQFNFSDMNIPVGAKLEFAENNDICATVVDEKKVEYKGRQYSLTSLTKELKELEYSVAPTPFWYYKGEKLFDIYNNTYK